MRQRMIAFGDSVVAAADQPEHGRWTVRLQNILDAHITSGWSVLNRGVGGDTTQQGLDRLSRDMLPLLPGKVLIAFGINDPKNRSCGPSAELPDARHGAAMPSHQAPSIWTTPAVFAAPAWWGVNLMK